MRGMGRISALGVVLALGLTTPALASESPRPGAVDARIRTVGYDPDQVVRLRGYLGNALTLEFAEDERIENVSTGDALGWQITPNKRANLLFLKPIDRAANTNMTVITDRRRYNFELSVAPSGAARDELAYAVRFTYPPPPPAPVLLAAEPAAPPEPDPRDWNFAYAWEGARGLIPSKVWDDGRATFFQWPEGVTLPTVFAVGGDGRERLVNMTVRGKSFVVEEVAPRFKVREGRQALTVVNQGWRAPAAGPGAPAKLRGDALKDLLAREHRW